MRQVLPRVLAIAAIQGCLLSLAVRWFAAPIFAESPVGSAVIAASAFVGVAVPAVRFDPGDDDQFCAMACGGAVSFGLLYFIAGV